MYQVILIIIISLFSFCGVIDAVKCDQCLVWVVSVHIQNISSLSVAKLVELASEA